MNIDAVVSKVPRITNSMISKASLPNFSLASKFDTRSVGIASLDELDRSLQRDIDSGREHQMHMFRHYDESMQSESSLPLVAVQSFQE